jgi:hypothetical protein
MYDLGCFSYTGDGGSTTCTWVELACALYTVEGDCDNARSRWN